MNTINWNCQGMGSPWKIQFLQDVIRQQRPSFVFLCETLSSKKKMEWVRTRLKWQEMIVVEAQGRSGGLTLLWRVPDHVKLLRISQNHIDVEVHVDDIQPWRLTGFYGEPNRNLRRRTYDLLRTLARDSNLLWCVVGDLNNIASQEEKRSGGCIPTRAY